MIHEEQIEDMVGGDGRVVVGRRLWWAGWRWQRIAAALGTAFFWRHTPIPAVAEPHRRLQWKIRQLSLLQRIVERGRGGAAAAPTDQHHQQPVVVVVVFLVQEHGW